MVDACVSQPPPVARLVRCRHAFEPRQEISALKLARGLPPTIRTPAGPEFALWTLGFRPFYLLASIFGALSVGLWSLQYAGWLGRPYLQGSLWHAHEMLFGFALAVIVGFLFTAGRNWTGKATPSGLPLAALALLWVAGRVLVLTPYGWAAAVANTAFPLLSAIALAVPFIAAGNRRNYFFIALLLLMSVAVLGIHLDQLDVFDIPEWIGIQVALDVLLFIMAVMAGRVVPMFTNNALPQAKAARQPLVEKAALGSILLLLAADVVQLHGALLIGLTLAATVIHLWRLALWRPWKTGRAPLVWVLHLAYAWIPGHLALRAAAEMQWFSSSASVHALTVGAAGGLIIGMMTRTARGHTGRPLVADRWDVACYVLVGMAAAVRVLVPLAAPVFSIPAVVASALLWSAGFGLYAIRYWPVLTRARVDGQP
jgi:uncharacterized protein involved in response to NO